MEEIFLMYDPIIMIAAVILMILASYTGLDLIITYRTTEKKFFLFMGGAVNLAIGIWVMYFMTMLAISDSGPFNVPFPLLILSLMIGIVLTSLAFYTLPYEGVTFNQLIFSTFLMTCSVLSIHFVYELQIDTEYQIGLLLVSILFIFLTFLFSFWLLFNEKGIATANQIWLKPVGTIAITGVVVEGHFLLMKATNIVKSEKVSVATYNENVFIYFILFISLMIFVGFIISNALNNKRFLTSRMHLMEIQKALDESSIVAITNENGIITHVNDKFVEISKFTREELIGSNFRPLHSGYHSKKFYDELWNTIKEGNVWRGEICNRNKDGEIFWLDSTIIPFVDHKGKTYQYKAIYTDITDRKLAEQHVKQTLKEISDFKFALDQSSIIITTNPDGILINVNDKFCKISKYKREEIIGKTHTIHLSGYHSQSFFNHLWLTVRSGKVWKGEICNKAKDGSTYWLDTTIVPLVDEKGTPYQFLSICHDITERKRAEEMVRRQEKLAVVGQLAAGVAHEIRNPLTSILGYTEFLNEEEKDENKKEIFTMILEEINRINQTVEDFMVLSKSQNVQLEKKNIVPLIKNVLSFVEFEAQKNGVTTQMSVPQEEIYMDFDEHKMRQVFLNFFKNAIEAMPNGGVLTVGITLENNEVKISIKDTGVGIAKENLKNLGEPFYTTKEYGNGLGLMVSYNIIESHNGKVYVESEINKGTTFHIIFPYYP